ncbi:MAG: threonylcarbamoyl-AMP synthase [Acidobacteria bacterium]|nr:threonylcarbamoyl-AMP synthase [Acidobacteriota bacterium]
MLRLEVNRDQPPDREILERMSHTMARGGIVAFPTETLYGLSVDPRIHVALERLFQIKHRPRSRRLPFVAAGLAQTQQLARIEGSVARRLADRFWPGPLTLVLPLISPNPLAAWDWGSSIGIRVPGSALLRGLAAHLGVPLPATSANLTGESAASDPCRFPDELMESIDLLLDSGRLPPSPPSTVLSLIGSQPEILRPGAVSEAELAPFLSRAGARIGATEE